MFIHMIILYYVIVKRKGKKILAKMQNFTKTIKYYGKKEKKAAAYKKSPPDGTFAVGRAFIA